MKKFIVLTEQRSGSTFLGSLLNQHSNILFGGELFLQSTHPKCWVIHDQIQVEELVQGDFSSFVGFRGHTKPIEDISAKGLVLHGHQVVPRLAEFEQISEIENLQVINLVRTNKLKRHVSQLVAAKTNAYQKTAETSDEKPTVWVNYNDFINEVKNLEQRQVHLRSYFSSAQILDVSYEDVITNTSDVLTSVYSFLGLPLIEEALGSETSVQKQESRPLSEVIENYTYINNLLQEGGYNWGEQV